MDTKTLLNLPVGSVVRINDFRTEDTDDLQEVRYPTVEYFIRSGDFCAHDFVSAETSSEADADHLAAAKGTVVVWLAPNLTDEQLKAIHEL